MKKTALLNLALILAFSVPAPAAILVVSPDEYPTIQAAIDDANDGDTVMVTPRTYTGPGNRDIDFLGKAITVRSVCPRNPHIVAATIIDCNGAGRGFYFHNGEDANSVLDGLTITNGGAASGGGIYCHISSPKITNCIISGNCADGGGGIYCLNSGPTIANCTISKNSAHSGGGIYCSGSSPTIADCTISENSARYGGGIHCRDSGLTITSCVIGNNTASHEGGGGGIYCIYSTPTITNCIISNNTAVELGAGIYCRDSSPTITNCIISYNHSGERGGGIYSRVEWLIPDVLNINNCTFIGNSAVRYGGAIEGWSYMSNCIITGNSAGQDGGGLYQCSHMTNCIISGNSAGRNGGGVYMGYDWWAWLADYTLLGTSANTEAEASYGYWSSPTITNCTFSSNVATSGDGGGIFGDYVWVMNCIFWDNTDSGGPVESAQISGGTSSVSFSCIQDDDPNDIYIPFGGEQIGNIDDDPVFVRDPNDGGDGWGLGDNDDFGDLHLQSGSPCVNAGHPFVWFEPNSVDMDGQPRVMGGIVDMGADEFFVKTLAVTKPEGGEVWVAGSSHQIKWESYGVSGKIDISYSSNNGTDWITVGKHITNTGSYMWHLPDEVNSSQCLVSIVPRKSDHNVIWTDSGLFTIHPSTPGPPVTSKWKTLGGDFDRMGLSEDYGPELGCVKWQFQTNGAVSAGVTIGPNDAVYVPCEDGNLYKLDANGVLLWSYDTNSPLISSPSIGPDGTVYVGSENKKLYAIDANGSLRWTHTADGFIYSSPAVSEDGNNIYVGSGDGVLYALGRDGSELWIFQTGGFSITGGAIFASPAIGADGTVYIGGFNDSNLYALDPNDGSLKWVRNFEYPIYFYSYEVGTMSGWPFASPVIAADGTIYQTLLFDPNLHAIDPNTGAIIWSLQLADPPRTYPGCGLFGCFRRRDVDGWSEPVLGPDGTIYASFNDANLSAVDPNGSLKWVTRLGMTDGFTLTIGSNGLIYAAGNDGYLCVVDPNGCEIARFQSEGWLIFPVISADNTIIVSDANNRVLAIGGDGCEGQQAALHRLADLDASWIVDYIDLALLAYGWLECTDTRPPCGYEGDQMYLTGDLNRNLYVDFADFALLANRWLNEDLNTN